MPVLIAWVIFCFSYLIEQRDTPLYSIIAETVLNGAGGFAAYGAGWVYIVYWGAVSKNSFILKIFKSVWWPVSPLFFVFLRDLDQIGSVKILSFFVVSTVLWFIFKEGNFRILEKIVKRNDQEDKIFQSLKSRSDLWWFEIFYWGFLSLHFVLPPLYSNP